MALITTVGADPARVDVDVVCGEPVDFTVPVLDGAGAAQDLTGWTLAATAHIARGEQTLYVFTAAYVAATGTVGDDDYDPGGVRVSASGDDTAGWADWPAAVRWSLWLTPPGIDPYLHAAGWVRTRTA